MIEITKAEVTIIFYYSARVIFPCLYSVYMYKIMKFLKKLLFRKHLANFHLISCWWSCFIDLSCPYMEKNNYKNTFFFKTKKCCTQNGQGELLWMAIVVCLCVHLSSTFALINLNCWTEFEIIWFHRNVLWVILYGISQRVLLPITRWLPEVKRERNL